MIYLLATGRSFRTSHLEDVCPLEGGFPKLKGFFKEGLRDIHIEVDFSGERKIIRVNGLEKSRLSELLGLVQIIDILPHDVLLLEGEPSRRRRFLDIAISQWDRRYYQHLVKYTQALRQRNKALQDINSLGREKIRVWNKILEENGSFVIWRRKKVVQALNERLGNIYPELTEKGDKEKAEVSYSTSLEGEDISQIANQFCECLLESENKDLAIGFTSIGPHREDILFRLNGQDAKSFGSEGQKRSLVIALKLALGIFLKEKEDKEPIFILDDVLTQLDGARRRGLMRFLDSYQSFLSITSIEFHRDLIREGKWFSVEKGHYSEFTP